MIQALSGSHPLNEAWRGAQAPTAPQADEPEVRKAFDDFVGEVFYGQLLKSLRSTQHEPAYFHGGRAEEMFQQQLDQTLVEHITQSQRPGFTDAMFELFQLGRK